jgi:hypothetical protein
MRELLYHWSQEGAGTVKFTASAAILYESHTVIGRFSTEKLKDR